MRVYCVFCHYPMDIYFSEKVLIAIFSNEKAADEYIEHRKKTYTNNFNIEEHEVH